MRAPNQGAALTSCTLRIILNGQGSDQVRQVLQSFGSAGKHLRQHASACPDCADLKRELFGEGEIPINDDPLTPELLALLRELDESILP